MEVDHCGVSFRNKVRAGDEDFSRVQQNKTAKLCSLSVLGLILITIFITGLADGIKHTHCKRSQAQRGRK